jgi:hypothetical protein
VKRGSGAVFRINRCFACALRVRRKPSWAGVDLGGTGLRPASTSVALAEHGFRPTKHRFILKTTPTPPPLPRHRRCGEAIHRCMPTARREATARPRGRGIQTSPPASEPGGSEIHLNAPAGGERSRP